jgi:hypothetical protein
MRISLVPRLSPTFGRSKVDHDDDPLLECLGAGEELNRAVLSGLIAAEPRPDKSRDGDPITVLLLLFAAPDERTGGTSTCCEVEVLDSIACGHRRRLRVGQRVWVVGQLTGDGLWATSIGTSNPR